MRKILIITAGLQFGGAERFATNIIKYAPPNEFIVDYLIFEGYGEDFASEIIAAGGKIIKISGPDKGYFKYCRSIRQILKENKYDVVHSNTQFNSGINLLLAKLSGVPIRIAHSHTTAHDTRVSFVQILYEQVMRLLILSCATDCCACGDAAGKWMYGSHNFNVIRNGIDTCLFRFSETNRNKIRTKYDFDSNSYVIGHSGTLLAVKNQKFLVAQLKCILEIKPDAVLMLVGKTSGDYKEQLVHFIEEQGVSDKVIFVGPVNNVNEYLSAFDVFAFPSLREGTPLALIEAQANGLPCIINSVIPDDAVLTDLVKKIPLSERDTWTKTICDSQRINPERYSAVIKQEKYDIKDAYEELYMLYKA